MPRTRNPQYKPLLYTTTIRNPERYKDFMYILKKFDGVILNEESVKQIETSLFKIGLYRPNIIPNSVKEKWSYSKKGELSLYVITDEEALEIYNSNDPNTNNAIKGHKEAGFPKGWASRFDTQFKLMKVLGFVYYQWNAPIQFSETGNYLANTISIKIEQNGTISRKIENPKNEQVAFLHAFSKQQRSNPFIRELNDNIPLILLLQVIKKLNSDSNFNSKGISYKEIPLVIFWKNNNSEELYQRIKKLREDFAYNPANEVIHDICVNEILGGYHDFKLKSIISEYPDEFIRKMRLTGLISFRGAGRFIDINYNEEQTIEYIIDKYSKYSKYSSERDYFQYMASIDKDLFDKVSKDIDLNHASLKLNSIINDYTWSDIKVELNCLQKKKVSKHNVLKFISAPARLEFLTALAIKSKRPNVIVIPNYPCDDEGIPTSTAGGNRGDIECIEDENIILVEVTMSEGANQTKMEVWPISRHLTNFENEYKNNNSQCIFVAPSIFIDTIDQIGYLEFKKKQIIRPYKISEFISMLESNSKLYL